MARRSIEELRRGELIQAALDVVAEDGHDAATVQRIARRAEISPGIVHHYFADKHALLCGAMRAVRKPVVDRFNALLDQGIEPLSAALDAHLDHDVLTVRRAAVWLQFHARIAYDADYARIQAAIRCRQVAALRRGLLSSDWPSDWPSPAERDAAQRRAEGLAVAVDGYWVECATREGGLPPGMAASALHALAAEFRL